MNLSELTPRVTAQVRMLAAGLALDPATLAVRRVFQFGGLGRASFAVTDARARYHLELAGDEDGHAALRRWHDLGDLLAARYGAPRICGWLEIVDTPFAGLVREDVEGRAADLSEVTAPDAALGQLLARLRADRELAARLFRPASTCRDAYLADQFPRFTARLRAVRAALPEFVGAATLAWLAAEVDHVTAQVRASPAFTAPADVPVHGDLRPGNLLVAPQGRWSLLAWDNLRLGDPALDLAEVPAPAIDPRADTMIATRATREPWLSQRVALLRRARALDRVLAPLTDWLAADADPEHRERVQPRARSEHESALESYRRVHEEHGQ